MNKQRKELYLKQNMKKILKLKFLLVMFAASLCFCGSIVLFSTSAQTKPLFQVGERFTYNISFENYDNAVYAEIRVVSKGKLQGKDAVELSAKLRSDGLVSAAYYLLDEVRSTFVSAETGLPFYVRNVSKASGLPKEKVNNFLKAPTTNYDLLSMIYKVRNSGGAGSFSVQENEQIYNFDFASSGGETIKIDLGEFETTVSTVQSSYLTDLELTDFRVNFTNDEKKIPVLIRFTTPKGKFKATLSSIQNLEPKATPVETTTKTPVVIKTRTPKPKPTATPYINNQKLAEDIPFDLGETLEFSVKTRNKTVGKVVLQATERKEFDGEDSLLLKSFISEATPGANIFNLADIVETQVEPDTLTPLQSKIELKSNLRIFNQVADFEQNIGEVSLGNGKKVNVPVGTHSVLSLAYAIRSFNLKPSLDPKNPVNDTRVAVLLGGNYYVLTLRPQSTTIDIANGKKISAVLVSIRTGNRNIDRLNLRLWLSNDSKRTPLRFALGTYQADLINSSIITPQ